MKKVIFSLLVGSLVIVSCSKKDDKSWQDSNTMLTEPETKVVDSAAAKAPVEQGSETASVIAAPTTAVDSAKPADSTAKK